MKDYVKVIWIIVILQLLFLAFCFGVEYGIPAWRDYKNRTSYATRAWSYREEYRIGYLAHKERTDPSETQTVDIYAGVSSGGLRKGSGVYIFVFSKSFAHTTDCSQVIYSGQDGYEQMDFAYDSYHAKYKRWQRAYHMTELPFHFQLNLIPNSELIAGAEGTVLISIITFGPDEDPAKKDQAELDTWIEWARVAYTPDTIEIPYYYDGQYIYWGSTVIEETKG